MKKRNRTLRVLTASGLAMLLAVSPVCVMAEETDTDALSQISGELGLDPEALAGYSQSLIEAAVGQLADAYEGYVRLTVEDAMRSAISMYYGGTDDMSWISDAEIRLKAAKNETGGADAEADMYFNGTSLYSIVLSYDAADQILYAVCPGLQDQTMAVPAGELAENAQSSLSGQMSSISPELIAEGSQLLEEFFELISSISPAEVLNGLSGYAGALTQNVEMEQGFATVTAGTLSAEVNTITFELPADKAGETVSAQLQLLAEDPVLKKILESSFCQHLLVIQGQAPNVSLYDQVQGVLKAAAESDLSGMLGLKLTLGYDNNGEPARINVSAEASGMDVELLNLDVVREASQYAAELRFGSVLTASADPEYAGVTGIVFQGSEEDNIVDETVSVNADGTLIPVVRITSLDKARLEEGDLIGRITLYNGDQSIAYDFGISDEDGARIVGLYINDDLWCTTQINLTEADAVEIASVDTEDPIVVTTQEGLAEYLRNADITGMIEKLADAGVPQAYVDMLTSGEASTESSRENVEDDEAA